MTPRYIIVASPDAMRASVVGAVVGSVAITPNLNEIARAGVHFENAFVVHPSCVPSRAAFVSARHPHLGGHRASSLRIRRGEVNLVRSLREAGYVTALVGSNHVVDEAAMRETFDTHLLSNLREDLGAAPGFPPAANFRGRLDVSSAEYAQTAIAAAGLEWLEQQTSPAFVWLNWALPHGPYRVPRDFHGRLARAELPGAPQREPAAVLRWERTFRATLGLDQLTEVQWQELQAVYLESCSYIDAQLAPVRSWISRRITDALLVVWGDHGDFGGTNGLVDKWSTSFQDPIMRTLLMFAGSGVPQVRLPQLVESVDVFPTILELAGVPAPEGIHGRSLLTAMRGAPTRAAVVAGGGWEAKLIELALASGAIDQGANATYRAKVLAFRREPRTQLRARMVRTLHHKYVVRLGDTDECYDLRSDPEERRNLVATAEGADLVRELQHLLLERLMELEETLPIPEADGLRLG